MLLLEWLYCSVPELPQPLEGHSWMTAQTETSQCRVKVKAVTLWSCQSLYSLFCSIACTIWELCDQALEYKRGRHAHTSMTTHWVCFMLQFDRGELYLKKPLNWHFIETKLQSKWMCSKTHRILFAEPGLPWGRTESWNDITVSLSYIMFANDHLGCGKGHKVIHQVYKVCQGDL